MYLDATTKTLEIDLNGAVSTNQLQITGSYVDISQSTFAVTGMGTISTQTNNTTVVTIVAAPGAATTRVIKTLNVRNADTASALPLIQLNDNSTLREQIKVTLAVDDTLQYAEGIWKVIDSSGQTKFVMPGYLPLSGGTLTGALSGTTLTLTAASPQLTLGVVNSVSGGIKLFGSTSGNVTIAPAAAAGASVTVTLPATSVTLNDGSALTGTAISLSGGVTQTAFANATTLLTLGGTGVTSVLNVPGTKSGTSSTSAAVTLNSLGVAENAFVGGRLSSAAGVRTTGGFATNIASAMGFDYDAGVPEGRLTTWGADASSRTPLNIYLRSSDGSLGGTSVAQFGTTGLILPGTLGVTGTITATGGLVLPGTAANITTGANFISYGGTDAGLSFDSSNNATLSATLKVTTGAAVGGATPGTGGLAFPATAVAVADANTLDDYEEGVWTPSFKENNSAAVTFTIVEAQYVKVGSLIFGSFVATRNDAAALTGSITWSLPFPTKDFSTYFASGTYWNVDGEAAAAMGGVAIANYAANICNGVRADGTGYFTYASLANTKTFSASFVYQGE